ncbi:MAG TPA: YciI family protein [Kofleriaceae bacterium]
MRFMMIVKATRDSEAGAMPEEKMLAAMGKYNEELVKAGVMLDGSGLWPSSQGARVRFSAGGKRAVIDGPFAEAKELIAGYWLIQVKSKEEAIEWAKRIPFEPDPKTGAEPEVELRRLFELEDFAPGPAVDQARSLADEIARKK